MLFQTLSWRLPDGRATTENQRRQLGERPNVGARRHSFKRATLIVLLCKPSSLRTWGWRERCCAARPPEGDDLATPGDAEFEGLTFTRSSTTPSAGPSDLRHQWIMTPIWTRRDRRSLLFTSVVNTEVANEGNRVAIGVAEWGQHDTLVDRFDRARLQPSLGKFGNVTVEVANCEVQ